MFSILASLKFCPLVKDQSTGPWLGCFGEKCRSRNVLCDDGYALSVTSYNFLVKLEEEEEEEEEEEDVGDNRNVGNGNGSRNSVS